MKQTAVKIVENKIEAEAIALFDGELTFSEFMYNINKHFNRAKEMEKEQIIDAVVNTVKIGTEKENVLLFTSEDEIIIRNEAEQYYNKTFKSN